MASAESGQDLSRTAVAAAVESQESAVDDSDDLNEDFADLQKTLSQQRRAAKSDDSSEARIQKVLPFAFLPNIRPLTISDFESCVALENSVFHAEHRATPEKFQYRLTTCPELSLGVFCTVVPGQCKGWEVETLASANPVESGRADKAVSVLLAHIISTRCCGDVITDKDMDYPKDWRSRGGKSTEVGHQESGRTVALHSLAVSPKLQGCGIGKMIVKAYLQQIHSSGLADKVALICQDYLVSYYERFGFKHRGKSSAEFGGGGWHDMVFELSGPQSAAS